MAALREPLRTFCDKPIVDFNPRRGVGKPKEAACRFNLLQYDPEWRDDWRALRGDANAGKLEALVVNVVHENHAGEPGYRPEDEVVALLVEAREQFAGLRGIYLDESARVTPVPFGTPPRDLTPILAAYADLTAIGSHAARYGKIDEGARHNSLRQLFIDFNNYSPVASFQFPALEHLELWSWSGTGRPAGLAPVFSGDHFPHLTYLGLRALDNAGEFVAAMIDAPILEKLETLDLSHGQLGDAGVLPMLDCPLFTRLKRIDLRGNNLTKPTISRLKKAKLKVDGNDQRKAPKYVPPAEDRYEGIRE